MSEENRMQRAEKREMIPATEDWCAKELFENREVREAFLSDILKIPKDFIKDTKILNPYLRKRSRREKRGIVDVRILLNNDKIINIEIQMVHQADWDKRQIFYLSRMYVDGAIQGEEYSCLPSCVSIAILNFNLLEDADYHHCYMLRDMSGNTFSDAVSLHILELQKTLGRDECLDAWIKLFNAKTEEDLNMIKTKNRGILEAIKELKTINLSETLRYERELRQKAKWDAKAREKYVRMEGKEEGRKEGREEGREEAVRVMILDNMEEGVSEKRILEKLQRHFALDGEKAKEYFEKYRE